MVSFCVEAWSYAGIENSSLQDDGDPAEGDSELRQQLKRQKRVGEENMKAVIDHFANRQARGRTSRENHDDGLRKKKLRGEADAYESWE